MTSLMVTNSNSGRPGTLPISLSSSIPINRQEKHSDPHPFGEPYSWSVCSFASGSPSAGRELSTQRSPKYTPHYPLMHTIKRLRTDCRELISISKGK
jgi:hypothetical protein